jgi:uncharacterized membrane protein YhaH (DUF805 family)
MYQLFNMLAVLILFIPSALLGVAADTPALSSLLPALYIFAVLVPTIAVAVRRFHDQDKSGAWYLLAFIPGVGGIILLVFMCLEGSPGPNRYGPNPKEPNQATGSSRSDSPRTGRRRRTYGAPQQPYGAPQPQAPQQYQ